MSEGNIQRNREMCPGAVREGTTSDQVIGTEYEAIHSTYEGRDGANYIDRGEATRNLLLPGFAPFCSLFTYNYTDNFTDYAQVLRPN